jgi:hypothetical protein
MTFVLDRTQVVDTDRLRAFASQGDRVGYWSYLSTLGDRYATLALGVAQNNTLSGFVANEFVQDQGRVSGVTVDQSALNRIGQQIMQADFAARDNDVQRGGSAWICLSAQYSTITRMCFVRRVWAATIKPGLPLYGLETICRLVGRKQPRRHGTIS